MVNRFLRRTVAASLLALAGFNLACDKGTPTQPTVKYTLSGLVSAMTPTGPEPVEGVLVEESNSSQYSTTDQNGFYSIPVLPARTTRVSARKTGYVTDTKTLTITGDTQLDIRVVRFVPYRLSGAVFEITPTGRTPIEGFLLYCDGCGEVGHTSTTTDAEGFYSFPWVYPGIQEIQLLGKQGYRYANAAPLPAGHFGPRVAVTGDTRFDIEVVRR